MQDLLAASSPYHFDNKPRLYYSEFILRNYETSGQRSVNNGIQVTDRR